MLYQHRLVNLLLEKINSSLVVLEDIFSEYLLNKTKSEYESSYEAGGFWNVTNTWIKNGMKESAQEMATVISAISPY